MMAVTVAIATCCVTANAQMKNMGNELTARQQYLSAIACLEAKGDQQHLEKTIGEALDAGLNISEIKEALSHLYAYTGFPRSLNGLGTLQRTVAARRQQGKQDSEGREASPLPKEYDALKQGTEVQTQLTGQPFNYAFAPATDYYLKAHLFGDIFARDVLSHQDREVVTIGALAGMEGVEPQLKAHVSGARNMGVSDAVIHALPANLYNKVGELESWRAAKAIAEVYGEPFSEGRLWTSRCGRRASRTRVLRSTSSVTAIWHRWMPRTEALLT